ncbi:MAG: thioredoxin-disulfide reductase [Candidatus Ratteibacteria bacterium]|nr:thioredoxin-disulfide reductase [Candidatus Ratteibacteria bacterium]
MKIRDVIVIGGGPGGMTAAIYTSRQRLKTLLVEKGLCGGLLANTDIIENYPGFPEGVQGRDLAVKLKEQAQRFEAEISEFTEVKRIEPAGKLLRINSNKGDYTAHALIVASGSIPRKLNVPGEDEYIGRGVSYCAICDAPLYKDKTVLVLGGGNTAAEEALFLTEFAREVILVHRRNELRADGIFQERLTKNKKIKLILNHVVVSINGKDFVESITVRDKESNKESKIETSGIFVYIGFLPNAGFLEGLVELDKDEFIITNEKMETSLPGIYAAGDVRAKEVRQITVACGEGALAAVSARNYLNGKNKKY